MQGTGPRPLTWGTLAPPARSTRLSPQCSPLWPRRPWRPPCCCTCLPGHSKWAAAAGSVHTWNKGSEHAESRLRGAGPTRTFLSSAAGKDGSPSGHKALPCLRSPGEPLHGSQQETEAQQGPVPTTHLALAPAALPFVLHTPAPTSPGSVPRAK